MSEEFKKGSNIKRGTDMGIRQLNLSLKKKLINTIMRLCGLITILYRFIKRNRLEIKMNRGQAEYKKCS